MDHVDFAYTRGMTDAEVIERLEARGTGVLALSGNGEAYAIPLAHYFDGEDLFFRLGTTEGSRKREFLATTEMACYVLYETESTDEPREIDSWSVLVTGYPTELTDTDLDRFDTAEINRRFSPIRVFGENIDEIEITIIELEIETMIGRITVAT